MARNTLYCLGQVVYQGEAPKAEKAQHGWKGKSRHRRGVFALTNLELTNSTRLNRWTKLLPTFILALSNFFNVGSDPAKNVHLLWLFVG